MRGVQNTLENINGESGSGSDPINALPYMMTLQTFLVKNNIKSVVDLGCGDWQFSRYIDWDGIDYTGIDCVPEVINTVTTHYNNHKFMCLDFTEEVDKIPSADMCILKDVIQHWPDELLTKFLHSIIDKKLFKYILITNCSYQEKDYRNCKIGAFVPVSPKLKPLSDFNPQILKSYDTKTICFIQC